MKTPDSLSQTILDAARDEVAREKGASSFEWYEKHMVAMDNHAHLAYAHEQAALLAMERQAEFYEDMSNQGWRYYRDVEAWIHAYDKAANNPKTTMGLYEIFTTQQ